MCIHGEDLPSWGSCEILAEVCSVLRLFLSLVNCLAHHTLSMLRLLATRAWRTPVAAASIAAIGAGGAAACMRLEEDVKVRGTLASSDFRLISEPNETPVHSR